MLRTAVACCLGLIFVSATYAQNAPVPPPKNAQPPAFDQQKMLEQMQQQMTAQFDLDKDGKLNPQESMMAQEAMRRQGINIGMPPTGFPGADQFAKQFDRDGDGKLNPQEAMMAQAAFQRMRGNGSGMRGGLNGNGGGGGGSAMPQQPLVPPNAADNKGGGKVSPLIKRFDKDGDGKLNAEEKAAAQAELKKEKSKDKDVKDAKGKDAKGK